MRNITLLVALLLLAVLSMSGQEQRDDAPKPQLVLDHLSHDFGTLAKGSDKQMHTFTATNKGNAPLIITRTKNSCRCISITTPKRPIAPGASAPITVTFNPTEAGVFNKGVELHTNHPASNLTIFVHGTVE